MGAAEDEQQSGIIDNEDIINEGNGALKKLNCQKFLA
jgi:hypothetical protein